MNEFIEEPVPDFQPDDSQIKQISEYMALLSDEAWKSWLEMMKVRRSSEKKMKEVEKQLEADAEKKLDELIEGAD